MTCNNRQPHHSAMPQYVAALLLGIGQENTAAINKKKTETIKKNYFHIKII